MTWEHEEICLFLLLPKATYRVAGRKTSDVRRCRNFCLPSTLGNGKAERKDMQKASNTLPAVERLLHTVLSTITPSLESNNYNQREIKKCNHQASSQPSNFAQVKHFFSSLSKFGQTMSPHLVQIKVHYGSTTPLIKFRKIVLAQNHKEEMNQHPPSHPKNRKIFFTWKQWQLWAFAGLLVLLFGLCWWLRKRSHELGSSSKQGRSTQKKEKDGVEDNTNTNDTWDVGRV
ncbi:hypothetical protein Anapl_17979 [Anas platyrhynchos]|uniref:Uncharacterized protein n=1 Tax=Anas platyrhynchos TaxID=8839 RepID=R0LN85_ANAPL|nr:hypothetical protein Anapl_17979 [Anas platyrhynchos]